jgi:hypothetical protein
MYYHNWDFVRTSFWLSLCTGSLTSLKWDLSFKLKVHSLTDSSCVWNIDIASQQLHTYIYTLRYFEVTLNTFIVDLSNAFHKNKIKIIIGRWAV